MVSNVQSAKTKVLKCGSFPVPGVTNVVIRVNLEALWYRGTFSLGELFSSSDEQKQRMACPPLIFSDLVGWRTVHI